MFDYLQRIRIVYSTQPPIRLYISLLYNINAPIEFFLGKVRVKLPKLVADHSTPNADVKSVLSVTSSWHVT